MPDHSVVSRVKRLMQRCRNNLHSALATSQKPFVNRNQGGADNAFTRTLKPPPKRENVDKTCKKIAEVIQTFPKLRFQIFGARNFAVATIKNTERLKNSGADDNADVIAAYQKYAGDQRQDKDRYRPPVGMNRKLEQETRYAARNRPIQKPRNETVLGLAH